MRRILLFLTVAAMLAVLMALSVGPALAENANTAQTKYTDELIGRQYFAKPSLGIGKFRALASGDLPGALDSTTHYVGELPGPGVEQTIDRGSWIFCSVITPERPNPTIDAACTSDSQISLTGTWRNGEVKWDEGGSFAPSCLAPPEPGTVYDGKAKVEGDLTVEKGGTVDGKTVTGGSGKFEGTIDHGPVAVYPCGDPRRAPIVEGTVELELDFKT